MFGTAQYSSSAFAAVDPTFMGVSVSGSASTTGISSVTVTGAGNVTLTGNRFVASIGEVSLKIDFDAAVTGISTTVSTNDVLIWQIIGDGESASWSGISEGPSGGWSEVSNGSSVSWSEFSAGPSGGWTEVSDASTIWTEIDP